jgi:hypothetical protein
MNNRASLQLGGDNWAAKDANLLAYKTSLSEKNFLPIEFDFERGSNLAATRVDENGLIEKGRENLLKYSEEFDNSLWLTGGTGTTMTPNATISPIGTQTAERFVSTSGGRCGQNVSVSNGSVYVFSAYYKNNGGNSSINQRVTGGGNEITNTITITNEWQRFEFYFVATGTGTLNARVVSSGVNVDFYVWGAQFEEGLVATDYIETGASTAQAGVLEDLPRIDYTGGTPSLLLELSRTNQIRSSEYFENTTNYDLRSADVTTNYATSPEGVQNATKVIPQNATTNFRIQTQHIFGVSGDNVLSVFAKYESGGFQYLILATNSAFQTYAFDIQNGTKVGNAGGGTIADADATIEDYGNGWYRCSIKSNNTGNADGVIYLSDDGTSATATGDGSKGMLIYGFQGEQSVSYPTSYIPTYGTATERTADNCFLNSTSILEQTSATYFLETTPEEITSNNFIDARGASSTNNRILWQTNSGGALRILVRAQGSDILDQNISSAVANGTKVKIALKYTPTNITVYVDGVKKIDTDVSVDFSPEINGIDLEGSATANDDPLRHHQFLFFPEGLSNDDLATLTTL